MFQIATDIDVPTLTAADVAVRVDAGGRPVFVIPDDVARALRRAGKAGWREVPDWAYGEGDRYPTGGLVHIAASVLLEVARTLPVGVDHMDAKTRGQILRDAAVGSLYAFVVGRSGFDDDTRWWVDYPANLDLHLPGSLHTWPGGAIYWAG